MEQMNAQQSIETSTFEHIQVSPTVECFQQSGGSPPDNTSKITLDQFLSAFFPAVDEEINLRLLPAKGDHRVAPKKIVTNRQQLQADLSFLERLRLSNKRCGVHFSVNSGGATKETINRFNAFFAEKDDKPIEEQHRLFDACPLPPSIRVETKRSVHAYWLPRGDVSRAQWIDIQQRLIAYFQGDPAIKDESRLMRLPHFNHVSLMADEYVHKPVKIVVFDEEKRHSVNEMQQAFPLVGNEKKSVNVAREKPTKQSLTVSEKIPEGQRNTALIGFAGSMRRHGLAENEIFPSLNEVNLRRCLPPLSETEVRAIAKSACRYTPTDPFNKQVTKTENVKIVSAVDLLNQEFPELRWAVPGLLPEGLFLLASKPKMGKSFLTIDFAYGVATGTKVLGVLEAGAPADVLCLALEDGDRRVQARLGGIVNAAIPARLSLAFSWPLLDNGGLDRIDTWLAEHPEARLITIDTLQKVRPMEKSGRSYYRQDYEALAPLTDLAHKYRVCILVVHHLNKRETGDTFDKVSGTTGLTGATDGTLILSRDRQSSHAVLTVTGRDVEERDWFLERDRGTGSWTLVGDVPNQQPKMSPEREQLLAVYKPGMTNQEIAELLGKSENTIRQLRWKMKRDGQLPDDNIGTTGNAGNYSNTVTNETSNVTAVTVTSSQLTDKAQMTSVELPAESSQSGSPKPDLCPCGSRVPLEVRCWKCDREPECSEKPFFSLEPRPTLLN